MVAMRVAALCVCVVLLCGCGAKTAKHQTETVIAHKSATGKQASATASADAGRFGQFSVRVGAAPNQRVTGGWVISCRGPGTMTSRDSHNFNGRTPLTVPTNPLASPDANASCTVLALATLAGSGHVTVKLLGQ